MFHSEDIYPTTLQEKSLDAALQSKERVIRALRRDLADTLNACQTTFMRCGGCNRLREQGVICPTNQEGGHCEAGL